MHAREMDIIIIISVKRVQMTRHENMSKGKDKRKQVEIKITSEYVRNIMELN